MPLLFLCRFVSGFRDIFILWRVYVSICKIISIVTIFARFNAILHAKVQTYTPCASLVQVLCKLQAS